MAAFAQSTLYRLRRINRQLVCLLARRFQKCAWLIPAERPIRSIDLRCNETRVESLLIFLPGIGDLPEDYELNGFIESVRHREISTDLMVADLHFGYYLTRIAVECLRDDIILPAQDFGYKHISLVGISLGGFGALYYAMHHPEDISIIFLLAPYLGDSGIIAEIVNAGGPRTWNSEEAMDSDYERKLWQWLKQYHQERRFPALYLGYGQQDIFATAHEQLAELLPKERVYAVNGRHDWHTWKRLWNTFLTEADTNCFRPV